MEDLDIIYDRKNTYSTKWDYTDAIYQEDNLLPLWIADMDFKTPQIIVEDLEKRARHGFFGYTRVGEDVTERFVNWINTKRNMRVRSEWITWTSGVMNSIINLIYVLTKPEDEICIMTPVYHHFQMCIEQAGRKVAMSELIYKDYRYSIDFDDIETKLRKGLRLVLLCNPHNPVGRVWEKKELNELGRLCNLYGADIISDEIHADIILPGHHFCSMLDVDTIASNHVFVCTSLSKTFNLAGLATAQTIISDKEVRENFQKMLSCHGAGSLNLFGIKATDSACKDSEEWHKGLMDYIGKNIRYVISRFNQKDIPLHVTEPEGTYLLWINCKGLRVDTKTSSFFAAKSKVALSDGEVFGNGGAGFVRMNIAAPFKLIELAVTQMIDLVKRESGESVW